MLTTVIKYPRKLITVHTACMQSYLPHITCVISGRTDLEPSRSLQSKRKQAQCDELACCLLRIRVHEVKGGTP